MSLITTLALATLGIQPMATVKLIPSVSSYQANKPFTVAIQVTLQEGWHTYWLNPGDSGMPSRVRWTLPKGWKASDLQMPTPEKFVANNLVTYGYHDQVVFFATITPGSEAPANAQLKADVNLLVCLEACLPVNTSATLGLRKSAAAVPNASAKSVIDTWTKQLPTPLDGRAQATFAKDEIRLSLSGKNLPAGEKFFFFSAAAGVVNNQQPVSGVERKSEAVNLTLATNENLFEAPRELKGILVALDATGNQTGPGIWITAPVQR